MGIVRGAGFILTEGRYFDVSRILAPGWRPLGIPLDWWPPVVMIVLAILFQIAMHRLQWGRAVYAVGGNETAALYLRHLARPHQDVGLSHFGDARCGFGRRAGARPGAGEGGPRHGLRARHHRVGRRRRRQPLGRARSVIGAVLGALIFGVLRNALAQIPGATFYDRMIVGVVVIVIVVMDQILVKRGA